MLPPLVEPAWPGPCVVALVKIVWKRLSACLLS